MIALLLDSKLDTGFLCFFAEVKVEGATKKLNGLQEFDWKGGRKYF